MRQSTLYAVLLGAGYAVFGVAYIVISSRIAASVSGTVEELRWVETIKGASYIVVTALGICLAGRALLSRIQLDGEELLKQQRALLTNERRVYAGLIASSIAHDANNVLTQVMNELDWLKRHGEAAERLATIERLDAALERLVGLNRRLQSAGHAVARSSRQRFELAAKVISCLEQLRTHPKLRGRQVTCERGQPAEVELEPVVVDQIVSNLVLNAGDATRDGGRVQVKVGREERAFIEVHDDGPGVPAPRRAGLFQALETTKPEGNGLGLFSVQAAARSVGGDVSVGDSPLGGARFRVELPLAS